MKNAFCILFIFFVGSTQAMAKNYCPGRFGLAAGIKFEIFAQKIEKEESNYLVVKLRTQDADVIDSSSYMGWDFFKERLETILREKTISLAKADQELKCQIRGVVSKQDFNAHNFPFCDLAYIYTCNRAYKFTENAQYVSENMEVDFDADNVLFPVSNVTIETSNNLF